MFFLYNKKTIFKFNEYFFRNTNKWRQCIPYIYTCKFNKMAVPWRYPDYIFYNIDI